MSGAIFEEWVIDSFKASKVFCERIKTRITPFEGDNEIADFYTFTREALVYLEAKSTQGTSFPFSMIKPNQLTGLYLYEKKWERVYGGFLVEMRKYDEVFYVPIMLVEKVLKTRKSINIEQLRTEAIKIDVVDGYLDFRNIEEDVIQWKIHKKQQD